MIVIRSCMADGTSWVPLDGGRDGYRWPLKVGAVVEAPVWDPTPTCGQGLHGLRTGDNDPGTWYEGGTYLALEVDPLEVVDLGGKCKFPRATIAHIARDMSELSRWLADRGHPGPWYHGTAIAGDYGTAAAGYRGTAAAGYRGTAAAGCQGTATAGDEGTATAGGYGTAIAGCRGTATAGDEGTAAAGDDGIIILRYTLGTVVGRIGEGGLVADTLYYLDANGEFQVVNNG